VGEICRPSAQSPGSVGPDAAKNGAITLQLSDRGCASGTSLASEVTRDGSEFDLLHIGATTQLRSDSCAIVAIGITALDALIFH
jgi:hypothetical protein